MFKTIWFSFLRFFYRLKARALPPPAQIFHIQCDTCSAAMSTKQRTMVEAIKHISPEFRNAHGGHKVGIFSEDGRQEDCLDWSTGARNAAIPR